MGCCCSAELSSDDPSEQSPLRRREANSSPKLRAFNKVLTSLRDASQEDFTYLVPDRPHLDCLPYLVALKAIERLLDSDLARVYSPSLPASGKVDGECVVHLEKFRAALKNSPPRIIFNAFRSNVTSGQTVTKKGEKVRIELNQSFYYAGRALTDPKLMAGVATVIFLTLLHELGHLGTHFAGNLEAADSTEQREPKAEIKTSEFGCIEKGWLVEYIIFGAKIDCDLLGKDAWRPYVFHENAQYFLSPTYMVRILTMESYPWGSLRLGNHHDEVLSPPQNPRSPRDTKPIKVKKSHNWFACGTPELKPESVAAAASIKFSPEAIASFTTSLSI